MTASILGASSQTLRGCRQRAEIRITRAGHTRIFPLPGPARHHFALIDFSPDGSSLLVAADQGFEYPNESYRDVEVAIMPLLTGELHWHNVWDLAGWKECDATVDLQGFTSDSRVVLQARKSIMNPPRRRDCVQEAGLYSVDLPSGHMARLPDATKIQRYGKETRFRYQPCKSDPDIVGACFAVHGRIRFGNGTPSARIWRIGTKRILGVHDEIMPPSLGAAWDADAYGDYLVCPFTKEKPGEMQMICIESAEHVIVRKH